MLACRTVPAASLRGTCCGTVGWRAPMRREIERLADHDDPTDHRHHAEDADDNPGVGRDRADDDAEIGVAEDRALFGGSKVSSVGLGPSLCHRDAERPGGAHDFGDLEFVDHAGEVRRGGAARESAARAGAAAAGPARVDAAVARRRGAGRRGRRRGTVPEREPDARRAPAAWPWPRRAARRRHRCVNGIAVGHGDQVVAVA